MCPDKCDVVVTINDGKITRVDPDQDSPRGRVCKRGAMAPKIIYSEKRIRTPLIRDGEREEVENLGRLHGRRHGMPQRKDFGRSMKNMEQGHLLVTLGEVGEKMLL